MTDADNTEELLPIEEEFFRAGDAISAAALAEGSDLDTAPASDSVWSRLFKRTPRPVTEPACVPSPQRSRPATEPAADEWDWQIAIARARHSTNV